MMSLKILRIGPGIDRINAINKWTAIQNKCFLPIILHNSLFWVNPQALPLEKAFCISDHLFNFLFYFCYNWFSNDTKLPTDGQ